ncbi:MAG: hypothetical protein V1755_06970 [Chloroflexota bacterium]
MKRTWQMILFGLLTWLIPFVVSILIFPIHETQRPLFESIMPVVVTVCAVVFSILHLRKVTTGFLGEGILIGAIWLAINLLIDLPLFSAGPMAMPLAEYVKDIGLTYLIIPVVAIGFGYLLDSKAD